MQPQVPDNVPILRIVSCIDQGLTANLALLPQQNRSQPTARTHRAINPSPPHHHQVDPRMAERMATWVIWGVISWQRRFEEYHAAQRAKVWDADVERRTNLDNCDVTVGVMGFGECGIGVDLVGCIWARL